MKQKLTISLFSQKSPDPVHDRLTGGRLSFLWLALFLLPVNPVHAQIIRKSKVTFPAADSLIVTADHYYSKKTDPYILLFPTENSSRGEFDSIAFRFARMRYNCLAVDLRSGGPFGYTDNETAQRAREQGFDVSLKSAGYDIAGAISYALELSGKPVVLLGSSSTASLSLIEGSKNPDVKAIIALSPGEFFLPDLRIRDLAPSISIPVFITGSSEEIPYMQEMFGDSGNKYINLFVPTEEADQRGTSLLCRVNQHRDQYWLAILIFIKSL